MFVLPVPRFLFTFCLSTILFVGVFLCSVNFTHAADLVITPSTGSFNTGGTFTATLQVEPSGASVNAAEGTISFDSSLLSVVSLSKNGSAFSLWTTEPEFSNTAGTISFGGGSPTPFTNRSSILAITFRALGEGTATISTDRGVITAADGRGTDVFENGASGSYTLAAAATPEPTPEPTPVSEPVADESQDATIAFGDPPRAPEVGSQTMLDPDIWYNATDALFTWELPFDVNEVAVDIASSSDFEPVTTYDPPIEEIALSGEDLVDGIQYLSVQFRNQVGWGGITNRLIKIDTTPPEPFEIRVQTGNAKTAFPLLTFKAEDVTSGIESYDLTIASNEPVTVTPDEAALGYLLGELEDGTYTVSIVARDFAGNEIESSVPVLITAGWMPEIEEEETSTFWAFFTPSNILITILILIILAQFIFFYYDRKRTNRREAKLRQETREIQDQMEKIFSALRDEIHDQIVTITKRPRLSKKEKEAVEGLHHALEVSETLIEKEISDVKKILK